MHGISVYNILVCVPGTAEGTQTVIDIKEAIVTSAWRQRNKQAPGNGKL